ncbi:L-idonate 5-dehydrogenase [Chromohalobacter sp. 296-RDG]|uniref:L-idonate 5-dehydrogenase n=1 Tax=Chromohalobacter sp. 296-RDG TaxID=2994062 RepID=UPI002468F6A4|nr:L-idonate 5-dehydrogenase [Chromohalobacter sp. 296-RDG]
MNMTHAVVAHGPHDLRIDAVACEAPGRGEVIVQVAAGGICGSDLHYYHAGGFGNVRLREPLTLGHEAAGFIASVGEDVDASLEGRLVAINPSRPCQHCRYCLKGWQNHCTDMVFNGSAMRFPHAQGIFRQQLTVPLAQCVFPPADISPGEAALAEPFAVALHAVRQADEVFGKRVLVTGAGPIGALTVLAARMAGAASITVTDVADFPLDQASQIGADETLNVTHGSVLEQSVTEHGEFDIAFEASGVPAAQVQALRALAPRGTMVTIGLGQEAMLPMTLLSARELTVRGTFRFHEEFALAVAKIPEQREALGHVLTSTLDYTEATEAFDMASNRSRALKVQLSFQ